jgi:hypothetical protein
LVYSSFVGAFLGGLVFGPFAILLLVVLDAHRFCLVALIFGVVCHFSVRLFWISGHLTGPWAWIEELLSHFGV